MKQVDTLKALNLIVAHYKAKVQSWEAQRLNAMASQRMRRALEMILELDTKRNTKAVYTEAVWFLACWGLEDKL